MTPAFPLLFFTTGFSGAADESQLTADLFRQTSTFMYQYKSRFIRRSPTLFTWHWANKYCISDILKLFVQ